MAASSTPLLFIGVCFAAGILAIAVGIPLYLRRVPPNLFYGVRFNSTLADDTVWYDINARAGRDAILIGALYLALFTIALVFLHSWSLALRVLGPIAILIGAFVIDAILLGVAAARLLAERRVTTAVSTEGQAMIDRTIASSVRTLPLFLLLAAVADGQTYRPIPFRMDPRAPIAAKRLEAVTLYDSAYQRPRRVWIYTPQGYDPRAATAYPLIVAFDGLSYRDTMPLPLILDTLAATRKAPAFVGVLVDDSASGVRIADLGNAAKMVEFLGRQLLPYVRARWHVTTDPHRVIVTGSSAGGLGAAFVAFKRPDLFGNVLSQSGAFWRGAEASNGPPYEWLTTQITASTKRDVNFFIDVGELEDHATLGGSGPNFRDANRRFRAALTAKAYSVTYTEIPAGQHAPQYWMSGLPIGIVTLTSTWR